MSGNTAGNAITSSSHETHAEIFQTPSNSSEARPYRSHKVPACDRCRKRKLRCDIELPNQPCRLCQQRGAECVRTETSTSSSKRSTPILGTELTANQSSKRRLIRSPSSPSTPILPSGSSSFQVPVGHSSQQEPDQQSPSYFRHPGPSSTSRSSMIVGPVIAEDVQLLEKYMTSQNRPGISDRERIYDTVSDNPRDPVIYLSVPRRREGLSSSSQPGEKQKEIFEQILGPHVGEVINLYFDHIHPAFPIIDEHNFRRFYSSGDKSLSPALICEVLASSLIYWKLSNVLRYFPTPDLRYCWNLAVAALQEEFLAPGMSTIHAVLLDLSGRPVSSITGNTINSGRTVALAHSLGLNRDPTRWNITAKEKNLRIRLWWAVFIHDRWSSFAHGVPALIRKEDYDIPLPTLDGLLTTGESRISHINAAECFIKLCTLTEILGDILPLIYNRRSRSGTEVSKMVRRLETELDNWEDYLPVWSRSQSDAPPVSGFSSLKLGFLSAKMLLCRIAFLSATHSPEPCISELQTYSQAMLRESAKSIIKFLCSLNETHLNQYWMPYSAYHLASATIILLRCTIDAADHATAESCKTSLLEFKTWLIWARKSHDWDLAEICLAQCEEPITNLSSPLRSVANEQTDLDISGQRLQDINASIPVLADSESLMNGFEYPFVDLWDMLEQENNMYTQ